jgi:hypothetical protein
MHPVQVKIYREMSPTKKLAIMDQLYWTAYELKKSGFKEQHPEWDEETLKKKVREAFLYAKS